MPKSTRAGFTLIEAAVWVAVLAILAVSFTPPLLAALDRARQDAGLAALQEIETDVGTFENDVGEFPTGLDQLLNPLVGGDEDICGDNYNGGERNRWDGPYLSRPLNASGLVTSLGTVAPDFVFFDLGFTGLVFVIVAGVNEQDVLALDARVDNNDGSGAGSIWWSPVDAEGLVNLFYMFMIPSC